MKNFRVMLLLVFLFDTVGVFFITKRNGNIDVWDLMDRLVSTSMFVIHVSMSSSSLVDLSVGHMSRPLLRISPQWQSPPYTPGH